MENDYYFSFDYVHIKAVNISSIDTDREDKCQITITLELQLTQSATTIKEDNIAYNDRTRKTARTSCSIISAQLVDARGTNWTYQDEADNKIPSTSIERGIGHPLKIHFTTSDKAAIIRDNTYLTVELRANDAKAARQIITFVYLNGEWRRTETTEPKFAQPSLPEEKRRVKPANDTQSNTEPIV